MMMMMMIVLGECCRAWDATTAPKWFSSNQGLQTNENIAFLAGAAGMS